jgi:ATP phosphoribosyltransferase regulatory subunit HisZ
MIKEQRMRALIQELNIDRQAFRDLMQSKVSERVKQAAANRSITPEQEKEILAKMELRSKRRELKIKRRELMSKLVENGIKDGTITQDEALMLKRKPR